MFGETDQRYENELLRIKEGLNAIREGLKRKDSALIEKGLDKAQFAFEFLFFAHFEHVKADEQASKEYQKHAKDIGKFY